MNFQHAIGSAVLDRLFQYPIAVDPVGQVNRRWDWGKFRIAAEDCQRK
jgi:hypothetical protein